MILYLLIIVAAMLLIAAVNLLAGTPAAALGPTGVALAVLVSTVAVILLDGLGAFLLRRLPESWFARGRRLFAVSRRECRFWQRLGVRRWKDKIPELGVFTGFRKNRVYCPQDNAYVARLLLECNYGVAIHLLNVLTGPLILLLYPPEMALGIGVPVAAVNAVLSLLPLGALRYNTPKLEALYTLNLRRAHRAMAISPAEMSPAEVPSP